MPDRYCPECEMAIPAKGYFAHRRAHMDKRRPRKGTTAEWRKLRLEIIERDRYRCRQCGSPHALEVHHIDRDWRNDDKANLITLCHDCHHRPVAA